MESFETRFRQTSVVYVLVVSRVESARASSVEGVAADVGVETGELGGSELGGFELGGSREVGRSVEGVFVVGGSVGSV